MTDTPAWGGVDRDVVRISRLMASVNELVSTLHHLTRQLEAELARLLVDSASDSASDVDVDGDGDQVGDQARPQNRASGTPEEQLTHFRAAIEDRATIELAKGILMGQSGCDESEAFQLLAERSRRERRKVRVVAAEVVRRRSLEAGEQGRQTRP